MTWLDHALRIDDFTRITSAQTLNKVVTACQATDEVSVEAWVVPAMASQGPNGRIVSTSDNSQRYFVLGSFNDKDFWASIHVSEDLTTTDQPVKTELTHLVATRTNTGAGGNADGRLRLFVNGTRAPNNTTSITTDNFLDWNDYPLVIGNVLQGGQRWKGEIHLIAIYSRALTDTEVRTNFDAGADP